MALRVQLCQLPRRLDLALERVRNLSLGLDFAFSEVRRFTFGLGFAFGLDGGLTVCSDFEHSLTLRLGFAGHLFLFLLQLCSRLAFLDDPMITEY